ncbi:MAG: HPP family protein [Candidatus Hydrothermarchaeales archaeon]
MEEIRRYTVPSIKIKDLRKIMEHKVVTVQKDDTIEELVAMFREHDYHGFPVLDNDKVVGVVTKTDLLKIVTITPRKVGRMFASHVEDIMTPPPNTVDPHTTLLEAVDMLNKNRIRTLPIVDGERFIGLLSYSDLVKTIFKF